MKTPRLHMADAAFPTSFVPEPAGPSGGAGSTGISFRWRPQSAL